MNPKNPHLPSLSWTHFASLQKILINHWTKTSNAAGWKRSLEVTWSSPHFKAKSHLLRTLPRQVLNSSGNGDYTFSRQLVPAFDLTFCRFCVLYWIGIALFQLAKLKKYQLWATGSLKNCKCCQIPTPQHRDGKAEMGNKRTWVKSTSISK